MDIFDLKNSLLRENKLLKENEALIQPDGFNNFKWNNKPLKPQDELKTEDGEIITKNDFWETDILGNPPGDITPIYGDKNPDGTWTFTWDEGEISGFIENEDFIF